MTNSFYHLKPDILPHISYIGEHITPDNWTHFPRRTNEYLLYIIYDGDMYLTEKDKALHLEKGDILILDDNTKHFGHKSSKCCYYYTHFPAFSARKVEHTSLDWQKKQIQDILQMNYNSSSLSESLYLDQTLLIPKQIRMEDIPAFHTILKHMQNAIMHRQEKQPYYKTSESCCLMEIFRMLSQSWMDSAYSHSQMDVSSSMYEKTNQLLNYLHTSYRQKITGRTIEEKFAMNFDYLNRIFKKRTQSTIFSYLNTIRLEQAKQLLLTTHLPISEIARSTGFSDEYYFSRTFRKHLSVSPSQYRKVRI